MQPIVCPSSKECVKCYHIMNIHDQFVVINTTQLSLSVCLPALYVLSIFCILLRFNFFIPLDNSFTNSDGQRSRTSEVIGKSDE